MITSLPWCSSGTNGIGGAGHDVRDRRQLVGRGLGRGDEPGDRLGRGGQDQHAADDRLEQVVQPELEPGGDAEVAAAAADRPEQVRVRARVDAQELAVGGHDLGREQRVDRQAVLAHEVADAAAERDAADADRAGVAEAGRQAVRGGGRRCTRRRSGRSRPRRSGRRRRSRAPSCRAGRSRCRRRRRCGPPRCGRRCGRRAGGRSRARA